LPVAFSHFLIGDKKFAYGSLTIITLFLLLQPLAFWKLQAGLFASGGVRKEIEVNITELSFTLGSFYGILIFSGVLLSIPYLHKIKRSIDYCDLLIIIYLLPSIIYIRTFIDIFMPLAFVAYSKLLMSITKPKLSIFVNNWKDFIRDLSCIKYLLKHHLNRKQKVASKRSRLTNLSLKPLLIFFYIVVIIFTLKTNYDQFETLRETEKLLAVIPNSQTILISFNQQYQILFLRPDLKVIPSSEIGMPSSQIIAEYINFFKLGRFKDLSDKTGATYLIEGKDIYIDPRESKHLELIGGHKKLKIWKIL
jgi:hypothetical protein